MFDGFYLMGCFFQKRSASDGWFAFTRMGQKKTPASFLKPGFLCGKRSVVSLSFANILRTDDVEDFKACRFHGADEFFIAHGSFIGDDRRAVCETDVCGYAVERAQGVGDAQTTMFAMHAVDEEREAADGGGESLLPRFFCSTATVRLAGQAPEEGSKANAHDADDEENPEDFHLIAPFPNRRAGARLRSVEGSRGNSRK